MKRLLAWTVCAMSLASPLVGCKDTAKLEACKTDQKALASGDGCQACCKEAGTSNYSYMNFDKASCECN